MYFLKQCENNDHEVLIKEREAKRHVTRSSRMNNRPRSDGAAPAWNGMTLTSASSVRPSVRLLLGFRSTRQARLDGEKKLDGRSSSLFSRPPGATRAVWALSNESCQPPAAFSWRGDPFRRHAPCRAGRSAPRHRWLCLLRSDSGLGCHHRRRESSPPARRSRSFVTTRAHAVLGMLVIVLRFFLVPPARGGTTDATVMPVNRTPQACVTWPKRCAPRTEPHLCQKRNVLTSQEDT